MGIQGLLPLLKSIMVPIHIRELEGSCVAVDTYSWLHKGALCCSTELCKEIPTSRHIDYCMHRVNLLRHYGVKPVMVFDGGLLPMKGDQENKRARSRKENLARAIEHEADGNSTAAFECYQKAVDISPAIAYELIQVLKRENVGYVVAPYEADAQLTFLAITKQVEAVITEDSDLIPFGCPKIIFKMDKFGQGVQFDNSMLQHNKDISFIGFSKQMVLEMCIMSGCDYLQSLPGMGLKKAHALMKKFKSYDKHVAKGVASGDLDPFTKLPFQGATVGITEKTYKVNGFKPERVRKRLQLPPQRNLLTNYMKMGLDESKNSVGDSKEQYPSVLHSSHAMLPCRTKTMLKGQECKEMMDEVGSKVCTGGQKVVVRSSYFQTKVVSQNSCERVNRKVYHADGVAIDKYKNEMLQVIDVVATDEGEIGMLSVKDDAATGKVEIGMIEGKDDSFTDKCEDGSGQGAFAKFSFNSVLPKLKVASSSSVKTIENGKLVTRSSYFQRTKVTGGDHKIEREMTVPIEHELSYSAQTNTCSDDIIAEDTFGSHLKQKVLSEDDHYAVCDSYAYLHANSKRKKAATNAPQESKNTYLTNNREEGKFGCNISHLEKYNDISGKSFHSLTSSLPFNSTGSRASGLRAPLKDVRNNSLNRRAAAVADISKFSYLPSKANITWKPRRG